MASSKNSTLCILHRDSSVFGLFLSLIRSPIPNRIVRTIGTLPYNYICHVVCFWDWSIVCALCCWSSGQWPFVWRYRDNRIPCLLLTLGQWWWRAIWCLPWCGCSTTWQPPPLCWIEGHSRGRIDVGQVLSSYLVGRPWVVAVVEE